MDGVRLTAQEFGDGNFQRRSRTLDEVECRVGGAALIVINHLPRDIEALGQLRCDSPLLRRTAASRWPNKGASLVGGRPITTPSLYGWVCRNICYCLPC